MLKILCIFKIKNMLPKFEIIDYKDKLYYVYRKIKDKLIKQEGVNEIKEYWLCDIVLKNKQGDETYLWFLREIPEAEVIEN